MVAALAELWKEDGLMEAGVVMSACELHDEEWLADEGWFDQGSPGWEGDQ